MPDRPNVLFVMTDQHRGDCVGADPACPTDAEGSPLVHTPNLNSLVGEGALFSRAYSPAPTCIPARKCLWSGQTPANADATGWVMTEWAHEHYLPELLADAGYQTAHVGKLHTVPHGKDIGFDRRVDAMHATGAEAFADGPDHEYDEWLWERSDRRHVDLSHGLESNTWDARPTHLDEEETDSFWRTTRALETLADLEDDEPFFMTLSYWNPHQPFDPPELYYEMYEDLELPDPYLGDWVDEIHGDRIPEYPKLEAHIADLPERLVHRARACYYGLITQIDHQLTRVFRLLSSVGRLENTYVIFTSDHGEMLGDHHLWRKIPAYEGSARVPLIVRPPTSAPFGGGQIRDEPVGLEDIMPTVLDIAGVDIPDAVDGRSLLDLIGERSGPDWREVYHGEHASMLDEQYCHHYLVTDRYKYIWNPVTGDEQLFDVVADPGEVTDLSARQGHADRVAEFQERLCEALADRPEEFTRDGELLAKERPYNWPMEGLEGQYAGRIEDAH